MTREEAIKLIDTHTVCFYNEIDSPTLQALHLAIEALQQQPVLDKIRAEILENSIEDYKYHGCGTDELIIETSEVLHILDKYRAESEGILAWMPLPKPYREEKDK